MRKFLVLTVASSLMIYAVVFASLSYALLIALWSPPPEFTHTDLMCCLGMWAVLACGMWNVLCGLHILTGVRWFYRLWRRSRTL